MKTIFSPNQTVLEHLLGAYREHLLQTAGVQPSTCQCWIFYVRLFLNAQFKPKATALDLAVLDPPKIGGFFQAQA